VIVDARFRKSVDVGAVQRRHIDSEKITTSHLRCPVDTGAVIVEDKDRRSNRLCVNIAAHFCPALWAAQGGRLVDASQ